MGQTVGDGSTGDCLLVSPERVHYSLRRQG